MSGSGEPGLLFAVLSVCIMYFLHVLVSFAWSPFPCVKNIASLRGGGLGSVQEVTQSVLTAARLPVS